MAGLIKTRSQLLRHGQVNSPLPIDARTGSEIGIPRDTRIEVDNQINHDLRNAVSRELERLVEQDSIEIADDGRAAIISDILKIHEINNGIGNSYIAIGQLLLNIYNRSREVYDAIVSPYASALPIGANVALKLRRIAEEVNRRGIDLRIFPTAYTIIYEIVTLEEPTYQWVMDQKLIHPKVQREEIKKWKKGPLLSAEDNSMRAMEARLVEKIKEKERIVDEYEKRIHKIDAEIEQLRQKIKLQISGEVC